MNKNKFLIIALLINLAFLTTLFAETEEGNLSIADAKTKGKIEFLNHYFNQCKDENLSKVTKGMSKEEIRGLVGGKEYPPFETVRGGFCFAVDEKRSGFFVFPNWMPQGSFARDFFLSERNVLYVRYDINDKVDVFSIYPLSKILSQENAGVKITQPDDRTLKLEMQPR